MKTTTSIRRLGAFSRATLAGALATVVLGAPASGMARHSYETTTPHHSTPLGTFTGGTRPGAYLLVKTPIP